MVAGSIFRRCVRLPNQLGRVRVPGGRLRRDAGAADRGGRIRRADQAAFGGYGQAGRWRLCWVGIGHPQEFETSRVCRLCQPGHAAGGPAQGGRAVDECDCGAAQRLEHAHYARWAVDCQGDQLSGGCKHQLNPQATMQRQSSNRSKPILQ